MNSKILVSGHLRELNAKLRRMTAVIEKRVAEGYAPFQHDEEWQYCTVEGHKVCLECELLNGALYRGDYIIADFPFHISLSPVRIRVHNGTSYHSSERCRCEAVWLDAHEVLVSRLCSELETA